MEISSSFTLSLHLHPFPPNPLAVAFAAANSNSGHRLSRIKTSTQTLTDTPPLRNKVVAKFQNRKRPVFAERDAFPESLPLHTKNPHAIYKDIQRFARQNKLKEALTIMDYLDQQGIPVNATTFSSLITACVRAKSLANAKQVHAHIRINGLENNEFLRTRLVHMYTACGSLEDAQKLFDESSSRSVYPWNALLRGTVMAGRQDYRSILSTYAEMRRLGVELNVYSFANIIKSFAGASALTQGLKAHALLIKNGLVGSSILGTTLIDMYFKCGKIKLARQMFDEITERDIVVWGSMIAGFAHNRLQREALEYTRRMIDDGIRPNSVILTSILPVIGDVGARRLGQEVHAFVIKTKNYSRLIYIQSALIDMYCKCGDIGLGRAVFYGSKERNAICWTALMSGYALNGRLEQAVRSVIWMQQEGFRPDVVTVATILPVCAKLRALEPGKEIHAYALKNYFLPNVSIVSSLMVMYSKCGVMDYSLKLFNAMEQRNVILWTTMIDSYIENQCLYEAIDIFRVMQLSKHRPDTVTMSRILYVCSELKLLKMGKEIHGQVLKRNFESVHFVSSELVKLYGKCGAVKMAKMVFEAVPVKGAMTWTAIIEAYGNNGELQEAIHLFDQMRSSGFTPNHFTFKVVLSVCNEGGFVDDALRIFKLMTVTYKIKASEEHYSFVIAILTRFGRIEEAKRYEQMSSSLS
ncbi:Pentatricopeptide repeat-containing protein, chloroplastic, partial [Cucurbita argyrosperma subsp. argyrosperma]